MSEDTTGPSKRTAQPRYQRGRLTWAVFAALFAFGVLNAVLGPALPYLRASEHVGYLVGVLHQVAFAVGGGLAGVVAARTAGGPSRSVIVAVGLVGAAVAALGVGYGNAAVVTVAAAFLVSLLGTSAMVRLWAALADVHHSRRTVAMTEGEVLVSVGGIVTPLLIGGLAGTALTWRFAFAVAAMLVIAAAAVIRAARLPAPSSPGHDQSARTRSDRSRVRPTLVIVFAVVAMEFGLSFWLASYLDDDVGLRRRLAVLMVAGLYAANLAGRLIASRLTRRLTARRVLFAALLTGLVGLPILLAATSAVAAGTGLVIAGAGIGASFPLASSLHVGASDHNADPALGQVFATAAAGQVLGPLVAGVVAHAAGLRFGLLVLPALAIIGTVAVGWHATNTPKADRR